MDKVTYQRMNDLQWLDKLEWRFSSNRTIYNTWVKKHVDIDNELPKIKSKYVA